jgi:hypothetical protein
MSSIEFSDTTPTGVVARLNTFTLRDQHSSSARFRRTQSEKVVLQAGPVDLES